MRATVVNKSKRILFLALALLFFVFGAYNTAKADFTIQSEAFNTGGEGTGYHDDDTSNRGGAYRATEGVDIYNIAGVDATTLATETGTYRVSYIKNGEWLKYNRTVSMAESGIYKIYLRVASTVDGNKIRMLNSFNGGAVQEVAGSDITFNRTGTFTNAAGSLWKDIEIGTITLKAGTNAMTLELINGADSNLDWKYSINYLKFVKQPIAELTYYNDTDDITPKSLYLNYTDYMRLNNWGNNSYNLSTDSAYNVTVLGDVEDAVVNGINEIRGFVWNLRDSTYRYNLDVEIYNSTGTTLLGKMENFAVATEINPEIVYPSGDMRSLIAGGIFPTISDYHGFSLGKEAILEHAKYRLSIAQGTNVKIKIVPRNDTGSIYDTRNLFGTEMISGIIPTISIYDTSVTVDENGVDMSQFPQITVNFTTTGIDSILKAGGASVNGSVNELSDVRSGAGNVTGIEQKPAYTAGPVEVVIVYEDTNSMNNAVLTKINNTIETLKSQGFEVNTEYLKFAIGAANTGIWSNAKAKIEEAVTILKTKNIPNTTKWIVLAAAANNYNPNSTEVAALAKKMIDERIIFTVVDQDTGNNTANDIETAFMQYSEGIRYYAGHLGVGKTGDYMLDTANKFILPSAKEKKWKLTYISPITTRDGTERRERFTVIDGLGVTHGPAIAYYRAPRYGVQEQTIILKKMYSFDLKTLPVSFTEDISVNDYEALKYVDAGSKEAILEYNYNNERYFQSEVDSSGEFNNGFNYTGSQDKEFIMINKSVTSSSSGVKKSILTNGMDQHILYYPAKNMNYKSYVSGDYFECYWDKMSNEVLDGVYYTGKQVMVRLVKGAKASAESERYNIFAKDIIKLPVYINNGSTVDNDLLMEFLSNSSRRYIDFIFDEGDNFVLSLNNGVIASYNPQKFTITGLPMFERYTTQIYTIKNSSYTDESKAVTYESSQEFLVDRPAIDIGKNSNANDIFTIDFINTEKFPTVEAYFTTKTRFDANLTSSSIYLKDISDMTNVTAKPNYTRPTIGGNMEEIQRSVTGEVVSGNYLQNIDLGAGSVVKSELPGFQYPLDIVFCVDNTASMQNEIENTAAALNGFTQSLSDMGFNVKFNLIIFGQVNQPGVGGIGNSGESIQYSDRNYLAIFNREWMSTSSGDIANLQSRLNAIANSAYSGYTDVTGEIGQENGQMAIYDAIQKLKNGGRSVAKDRTILNDNSGVLPSKKLIIVLTDELMDDGTIPPGCSRATLMKDLRNMMDITTEDKINLAGIFHVQNYGTNISSLMVNPTYSANYGTITKDCVGHAAEAFYDDTNGTSKRYYMDFTLAFEEQVLPVNQSRRFRYYEMGTNGTNVQSSLDHIAADMGMIKRWKVIFTTPHTNTDGTYRDIFFDLKNISGVGTTLIIPKLSDVSENRRYRAPDVSVEVELISPLTNGNFEFLSGDNSKVKINGKVRAKEKDTTNYKTINRVNLTVYNNDSSKAKIAETSDEIFEDSDKLTEGWYKFEAVVPVNVLIESKALFFDVKAVAISSGMTAEDTETKISLDSEAPKLISLTMTDTTTIDKFKAMKLSDGAGDVFNETQAIALSTLNYENLFNEQNPEENYSYNFIGLKNITLDMRNRTKDGRFVKGVSNGLLGDEIVVTAVLIDENFDTVNANSSVDKNVIKAQFGDITNNFNYIVPTTISYDTGYKIGAKTGVKIFATWNLNVASSEAGIAGMKLKVIDAIGRSTENRIGNIDIAVVDNTPPANASIKISKLGNANPVTITNSDYEVNCTAPYTIDENGIRAFKVLYTYDSAQSDWGSDGRTDKGKHDGDKYEGSVDPGLNGVANRYFYIKAGDGINLIDEIIQPSEGTGIKELAGRFDDGMYSKYRVLAVDKAGNETAVADIEKTLIVDTVPPRITGAVLKKIADGSGFVPKDSSGNIVPYLDNLAKGGDTVRIEYSATDFNIASENTTTYYDAGYLWMLPSSIFQTSNVVIESIDTNLTYESANEKGYKAIVKIGEKDNRYSSQAFSPNIIIQNKNSNGPMPTTIIAKDLAGNIGTVTISPELDNTLPAAVEVYAYAYELYAEPSYEQYVEQENILYGNEAGIYHITRGGDVRDFFVEFKNITEDAAYYTVSLGTIESSLKDLPISTGNKLFSKMHGEADFMPVHGLNSVSARVRDLAGNQSEASNVNGRIVLDTMVGNASTMAAQQGGTAKYVNNGYQFAIKLILPEYAGIKNIQIKKIANGTILKEINGVEPLEINQVPNCLGINETISKTMIVPKSQIPDIVKGTRVNVTFRITDNLDNHKDFSINYLIPKEGVQIKAQQTGSEKETRTKVKVVGENQFELQNMEEGGKTR